MKIKLLLVILCVIFCTPFGFAKNSKEIKQRSFSDKKIEDYKNERDFRYGADLSMADNAWNIFKSRLFEFIKKFFSNEGAMPIIRYIILAIAMLLILYRIFGMKANSFFEKNQSNIKTDDFFGEVTDIATVNFENEAKEAHERQDFRVAVRFLFLHCLQLLETNQLIRWQVEKTNACYLRELKGKKPFIAFREVIRDYNFVWYGHFELNEKQFHNFQNKINRLKMYVPKNK